VYKYSSTSRRFHHTSELLLTESKNSVQQHVVLLVQTQLRQQNIISNAELTRGIRGRRVSFKIGQWVFTGEDLLLSDHDAVISSL